MPRFATIGDAPPVDGCPLSAHASGACPFRAESLRFVFRLRAAGLEPARPCGHWILSPMRLPFRHAREYEKRA